ncbi:MAG TPA: hypothetical protein VHX88_12900 [Solirubrobacteraceae bacterium]|nr:hypothetical protein [Solirubrobacteraceae bacterium]
MPHSFDALGWLQFERLCELVLTSEAGLGELAWQGRADGDRVALVPGPVRLDGADVRLAGPVRILVRWVRGSAGAPSTRFTPAPGATLVLTNRSEAGAPCATDRGAVLGPSELGVIVDRHPSIRAALPALLGLRDLGALIDPRARKRSTLDVDAAQALARVFVATAAYQRAREVLGRHRFVVLTGPPEMGKTAIARMIALAQLSDGWEAHECTNPDQLRAARDPKRGQVFVADDAFGSTEYRADAAERWARELGRILRELDERHWLIWTSRPAPLRAGLRRVQRERGAERFPAPGEVLVDASDLALEEKALILFRHAKDHGASAPARAALRREAVAIVEHPHFTPERIRRLIDTQIDLLGRPGGEDGEAIAALVRAQLTTPTDAMRVSYRALGAEHRALLIALLDAPAGLVDERALAATLRRQYPGGLSRPPVELVDRLSDHFLHVSPLGIGWVHPSWRDLVIDELADDAGARQRFLRACGPYGALLALSRAGGAGGERSLPLLLLDGDWDALADRSAALLREGEDRDVAALLLALPCGADAELDAASVGEAVAFAREALATARRAWDRQGRALSAFLLDAWYTAALRVSSAGPAPQPAISWAELRPSATGMTLAGADDWLALAEVLHTHDPEALHALGFPSRDGPLLERIVAAAAERARAGERETRELALGVLDRIARLAPPDSAGVARARRAASRLGQEGVQWWVPSDLPSPPSTELERSARFGLEDVGRVLADL